MYVAVCILLAVAATAQVHDQVIQGEELEGFLRRAEITGAKNLEVGITAPRKLTMVLDGVTRYGVFKVIDEAKAVMKFDDGRIDMDFEDRWKSEIAAYEVDRIIGLGMVPATLERTYKGQRGSMQFFVDSILTLGEKDKKRIPPPDIERWNQMMYKTRLFDNLIYNTDRNIGNLLINKDWEVILIDHSRAFRPQGMLRAPKDLERFSRSLLEGIKRLNTTNLTEKTGKHLLKTQIQGLLKRRDLILEAAKKVAAQKGEAAVYYP